MCVHCTLSSPLSQDCHQDIVKTLFSTDIVLLSGIVFFFPFFKKTSVFFLFCQQSPLTTIHLIYLSPYLYLNTVSLLSQHYQHYLTSISTLLTLTHFLKPCTSVTDFFSGYFTMVITALAQAVLLTPEPKKYEPQHNRAVGLVQNREEQRVQPRECVNALSIFVICHSPPLQLYSTRAGNTWLPKPLSGKTDIETIVMTFA